MGSPTSGDPEPILRENRMPLVRFTRPLLALTLTGLAATAPAVFAAEAAVEEDTSNLLGIYRSALHNEPQLAAARHQYMATREQIPQARANLLPRLTASGSKETTWLKRNAAKGTGQAVAIVNGREEMVQTGAAGKTNQKGGGYTWQAQLSQPLFHLDSWYQLRAAKAQVDSAAADLAAQEQQLMFNSAKAYIQALQAQDALSAKKAEAQSLKRQWDQAEARLKGGMSSITDVLDAKAAYDVARAELKRDERNLDDAFEAITRLTGQPITHIDGLRHNLPLLPPEPFNIQAWSKRAIAQSPQLEAAQLAITAAEKQVYQRKADHLPTLDLTASYGSYDNDNYGYLNPQDDGSSPWSGRVNRKSIAVQLNVPLYTGGAVSSQVRESIAQLSASKDRWEDTRRKILEQTRNAFRAIDSDIDEVKARLETIKSSAESLKASQVGADLGLRNTVDILNAQRQLYDAVRDYNNARYDFILNTLTLKLAVGTLNPRDLAALAAYTKADYDPDKDFLPPQAKKLKNS